MIILLNICCHVMYYILLGIIILCSHFCLLCYSICVLSIRILLKWYRVLYLYKVLYLYICNIYCLYIWINTPSIHSITTHIFIIIFYIVSIENLLEYCLYAWINTPPFHFIITISSSLLLILLSILLSINNFYWNCNGKQLT